MEYKLENDLASISVLSLGSELCSFRTKKGNFEYLWYGDPAIWKGHSPILFPIAGRLLRDQYQANGKTYTLKKHGFAKLMEFSLEEQQKDSLILSLRSSAETEAVYPYPFILLTEFHLEGQKLTVTYTVENPSDSPMYFSIGAHPGFNCAIGDYLEFEQEEDLPCIITDAESMVIPEPQPFLNGSRKFVIQKDSFDRDALFLHGLKSTSVSLKSDHHQRVVTVEFGDAPYLGIWAKPGAPYVCIEPWYGINETYTNDGDFTKKEGIVCLEGKGTFHFIHTITVKDNGQA